MIFSGFSGSVILPETASTEKSLLSLFAKFNKTLLR